MKFDSNDIRKVISNDLQVSISSNMVNRPMHCVFIALPVVNNYKVKPSNKKLLVHEQIFQPLLLMLKAVRTLT